MTPGTIKIAEHEGVFVIKMEGDVRLTLCLSFDEYIEKMLSRSDFSSVVFDLTHAQAIDSTTLGLMAKISIKAGHFDRELPIVVSNSPSITRLLVSMGFDDIFRLVENDEFVMAAEFEGDTVCVQEKNGNESAVKKTVLEAHRLLMALNEDNQAAFKELVETLEADK